MKHKIGVMIAVFAAAAVIAPTAYAVESSGTPVTQSTVTSRVSERRTKLNEKLTAAQSLRIQSKCAAAQSAISTRAQAVNEYNDPIDTKYDALIKDLGVLMQARAVAGKKTPELNAATATLTQKYQAFKAAHATLKLDLSDLQALDCKTDAAGFSATLQQSRTDLATMRAARADLIAFTKDSIIKNLQSIKKES